jgi:hypothetical protein
LEKERAPAYIEKLPQIEQPGAQDVAQKALVADAESAEGPFCFRSGALSCGPRGGLAPLVVQCSLA